MPKNEISILPPEYFVNTRFQLPGSNNFLDSSQLLTEIIRSHHLNAEQEHVFCMVAEHASTVTNEPLLLYIGGMGGTDKSEVIKTLEKFFKTRNESYRFAMVGPTGSSAALLHGVTYRYLLGINSRTEDYNTVRNEATNITNMQDRIAGVEYIFLDEVSIVSCSNLHDLSDRNREVTTPGIEPGTSCRLDRLL
ncbi:hypothetical protein FPV67DRAFT_1421700 [Lyophyllum atratum]|nr:hypothetical protein FPV67DRAFT_1421700 [Lyophyllum atratum]